MNSIAFKIRNVIGPAEIACMPARIAAGTCATASIQAITAATASRKHTVAVTTALRVMIAGRSRHLISR